MSSTKKYYYHLSWDFPAESEVTNGLHEMLDFIIKSGEDLENLESASYRAQSTLLFYSDFTFFQWRNRFVALEKDTNIRFVLSLIATNVKDSKLISFSKEFDPNWRNNYLSK